ncbi:MAG TPA: lipopolysaccharide biosynthesis protein [Anaeromyxobacteraceae bacterium]|nr:lipopolysaccharide biosynthesis protein [Anaeromyxobacteraceae bacterium]
MERTYTVQDLLAAMKRRRRLALAITAAVFVVSAAVILALPSEYSAQSMTQIEPHRLAPDFFPGNAVVSFEDRMRTLRHGLLARPVLERVIKDTRFFDDADEDMDRAVEKMRRQVEVRLEGEVASGPPALLFIVEVKGRDPEKVARAAELLPRYYADMTREVISGQARHLRETLEAQVATMSQQLTGEEAKLLAFKTQHATETPEASEANMRAATRIAAQMDLRLGAIADGQRRRTAILASIPELESDAGRASMAVEEAQRRLELARANYGEGHPDVKRAERALADARTRADEQTSRFQKERLEAHVNRIDTEIRQHQQAYDELKTELATYQKRLDATPRWGEAVRGMSRDYETLRAKYTSTLSRAADAAAAESLLAANSASLFRTIQPAVAPNRPAGPNRIVLLLIALGAAVAAGLIAAAASEYLDSSLRGPEDATHFGVPVLASIPRIGPRKTA